MDFLIMYIIVRNRSETPTNWSRSQVQGAGTNRRDGREIWGKSGDRHQVAGASIKIMVARRELVITFTLILFHARAMFLILIRWQYPLTVKPVTANFHNQHKIRIRIRNRNNRNRSGSGSGVIHLLFTIGISPPESRHLPVPQTLYLSYVLSYCTIRMSIPTYLRLSVHCIGGQMTLFPNSLQKFSMISQERSSLFPERSPVILQCRHLPHGK